ncbi:hypothetical protein Bhyg_05413 [Pseudolycoriella hygida]|uniref:Uncharacterized protein n=1 Tax=Pseudolycoriella hygida TaxID=35572 RepID=A0A9Q0SA91_9DIPT|nr:hypothetical protein Bhyg_05413 [Pseudolycoriella hygida]
MENIPLCESSYLLETKNPTQENSYYQINQEINMASSIAPIAPKKWTESCPEQQQLNRMFAKQIDDSTLPNKIRQSSPAFMAFPAKVFAAHFRKTKVKYGAYASNFFFL